ncbi:MAG: beta-N-acetylhexosaminidase [Acidobacteriota bacterium]|nr:beta-N-acetylhexosaminidase [Acidobacteriota bacterium]
MSLRDLRRTVGQLAIVGFDGHSLPEETRAIAREFDLGGVIYFARNVQSPEQVADLSAASRDLARETPLWISVDQEGGRVARLRRPFTEWPPMMTLGRSGGEALAVRFARALARELGAVGINLDYAPVLDIHTNPDNPVIGDRAFSERADDVARIATAIIRTLQSEGIAACGKHFPGHGDTSTDSHHELPVLEHGPDRFESVELVPFRAAVEADVACIMTAHVLVPAYDADRPATLSPHVVDAILKKRLGYQGIVISDDLAMKAVSAKWELEDSFVAAIAAGCDAVLLCDPKPDEQAQALEAVIHAVESKQLKLSRVEDALARQQRVKARFLTGRPAATARLSDILGCAEHQAIAEEMAALR